MVSFRKLLASWIIALHSHKSLTKGNALSLWLCSGITKLPIRKILGAQLATLTFASAFVAPQITSSLSAYQSSYSNTITYIDSATLTKSTLQWPLDKVGVSQKYSTKHAGVDLAAIQGTVVKPIAEGTINSVVKNTWVEYGNHVTIVHDNGTKSLYAHMSKITATEGQSVDKATVIGTVGSTGKSTGNHLHLEIHQNDTSVNPMDVLPALPTPSIEEKKGKKEHPAKKN